MKYLTATEIEERLNEVLVDVARGETYIITNDTNGEAVAEIVPCKGAYKLADEMALDFGVVNL